MHLVFRASIEGRIVRGPMIGRQHAFARVPDWLSPAPPPPRETALAELARRYLAGHGPASDRDLARWAGLPLRDARAGLGAIAGELRELAGGLVDLARRARAAPLPRPRLLGAFEPLLLGWASRADVLGADRGPRRQRRRVSQLRARRGPGRRRLASEGARRIEIEPFAELAAGDAAALARDGEAVRQFLS